MEKIEVAALEFLDQRRKMPPGSCRAWPEARHRHWYDSDTVLGLAAHHPSPREGSVGPHGRDKQCDVDAMPDESCELFSVLRLYVGV